MTETLTVSFQESERYDVTRDANVVLYIAKTSIGSFSSEVPASSPREIRENREAFKTYVLQCMAAGISPHEVHISDSPEV